MTEEITVSEKDLKQTEEYLKGYKINRRLLMMKNYEKKYFDTCEWESDSPADFSVARIRMHEIRKFIMELENSNEKLLLYYHFVRGEPTEKCAELLGMSRSSAFRLKKRALALMYKLLREHGKL